jgi:hypothetical protein
MHLSSSHCLVVSCQLETGSLQTTLFPVLIITSPMQQCMWPHCHMAQLL